MIVQCAWCGRVKTPSGWEPQSLANPRPGLVTHGVCQDCESKLFNNEREAEMEAMYYVMKGEANESAWAMLADALLIATSSTAMDGEDRAVVRFGTTVYAIEADTKVDDEDATFPVIVHTEAGSR